MPHATAIAANVLIILGTTSIARLKDNARALAAR